MALPVWPSGLDVKIVLSSWSMALSLDPISTEMEGGNVRRRRRPGDDARDIEQSITFTATEYSTFETFYRSTLNLGTSRFTMPVWIGPSAVANKTVQIMEVPKVQCLGPDTYIVPMKLRVYG